MSQMHMTGLCVVGPGFDSTYPAFVRNRARHAAGSVGRLAKKGIGPPSLGAGVVNTQFVQMSAAFQPRTCCFFLEQVP